MVQQFNHPWVMPEIKPGDFEVSCLKPFSYHEDEIPKAIVVNIKRPDPSNPTERQKNALERFKYHGSFHVADPENSDDIEKFFEIFKDLFFGGLLTGFCKLEFCPLHGDGGSYEEEYLRAYCKHFQPGTETEPRFLREKPYNIIALRREYDRGGERRYDAPVSQFLEYLGRLAHVLLYATFFTYTRTCESGCRQFPEHQHGRPWQVAAKAIEETKVLGWNLDCRREYAFVTGLDFGMNLPNDIVLREMGLDISQIIREISGIDKEAAGAAIWMERLWGRRASV